jgi:hypothetical protein
MPLRRAALLAAVTLLAATLSAAPATSGAGAPDSGRQPAVETIADTRSASQPEPCTEGPFDDVGTAHPFCAEIAWMADEGISDGFPDGTFRPTTAVSRQAFAAFLARSTPPELIDLEPCTDAVFEDVGPDHPFCAEIAWMTDEGIATGWPDGTFRPGAPVTRQAAAAFIGRYAEPDHVAWLPCDVPAFVDVSADHPFCPEITWLTESGITDGFADGSFRPTTSVARQAAAAFMFRLAGIMPPAPDGFVDPIWFAARQDDYLAYATEQLHANSWLNVLNHLERADRDPGFDFDATGIGPENFESSWTKFDDWLDTADFDLLYMTNLWYRYGDLLDADLRERIEQTLLDFKYWYTDPTPDGVVDQRWYWSENHRIIFHTLEYLAGQAFPTETFTISGLTGAEHRDRAAGWIDEWLEEKADLGFSEWHSDVYYQKDVTPLLTLVELADDEELADRAAMMLDLVLFDLGMHILDGNMGVTHGRSYMKDKSQATDQDVFGIVKLLWDDTTQGWQSRGEAGASLLSAARRYRMPEVLHRVGTSTAPMIDRERMGVPVGLDAELVTTPEFPEAPYGQDFDDPASVPFWWERGALTAWPFVPTTLATIELYDLWETPAFAQFSEIRDIVEDDYVLGQQIAHALRHMLNVGLLDEVNTYTYRTGNVMLSSALDYRPGAHGNQYHAWQATLGAKATVFTTHPGNMPRTGDRWVDGDQYWTGTGSMPRTAQHGPAAIHLYSPAFENPTADIFESFRYLEETHAWFPTEHFDEVHQEDNWVFGRAGDGFVALWSWRDTEWRTHGPDIVNQGNLTEDFDLVAPGGADNVWIVEVADAADWGGSFAAFRAALLAAEPQVTDLAPDGSNGPYGGFDVTWTSPSAGAMTFGNHTPFTVDGQPVALDDHPRFDNPWTQVAFGDRVVDIAEGPRSLVLDFDAWTRHVG